MRFHFILALLLTLPISFVLAQEPRFSVAPRIGYGSQSMDWSIAGNLDGTGPNILSELIWNDLRGTNFGLQGSAKVITNLYIIVEGDYQRTSRGGARDTDYSRNNRTGIDYDEFFNSNEGYFYNFSTGARYTLPDVGPLSPRVFLNYQQMGNELFLLPLDDGTSDPNVRTTYQTDWYGGQIGLELAYQLDEFYVSGTYGFGLYDYRSKARWNLIADFEQPVSFRHFAMGLKHNGILRMGYQINPYLAVEFTGIYNHAFTNPGLDELYTRSRGTLTTQFNGANLKQYSGALGLRVDF